MSEALVLFISGVTGPYAAAINGVYDRSSETSGGYALYRKRGDGSMCMEHFGGRWQIKAVSNKGTAGCWASVAGGCAAEACTSHPWRVTFDDKTLTDAPLVKMVAGAEAERQVGCCRLHAPPLHLRTASSDLSLFLRRALSMPPPRREPLPTTTRALLPWSSAAPQVLMLL